MAKEEKKPVVKRKVRAEKYAEKVHFEGSLEDMIKIAVKPISKTDGDNKICGS